MKIYLDLCCLKRPFDNQSDERIRLETVALESVLRACRNGNHELVWADPLDVENEDDANPERRSFVVQVRASAVLTIPHNPPIELRAVAWNNMGVRLLDALHLASAEVGNADYFGTTDDVLLKRASRMPTPLRIVSLIDLVRELLT
jgi:hypothetical protein